MFGLYVTENQNENSDIDLAIVLDDSEQISSNAEVKLMVIRFGEETIIEPHPFTKDEFDINRKGKIISLRFYFCSISLQVRLGSGKYHPLLESTWKTP